MTSCDDGIFLPVVGTRSGCTNAAGAVEEPGCAAMEYPAVTVMGVVPVNGSTFELKVSPVVGFRTGNWVVVGTGGGTNPFYAQVTGKTATGLMLRNSMPDGTTILRNPAQGSDIPQCSAVAICGEPPNVSADPITRCTPDMAIPSVGEIVGLAGLTRSDTVSNSGKCARFVHRVGTDGTSLWLPDLPGATDTTGKRLVIYDTATKTFKWLDAVAPGWLTVSTGGAFTTTTSLNGLTLPLPTGGILPTGSVLTVYDPASKAWYQMPPPPSGMVNPYLTWSTTVGAVGPVWASRPSTRGQIAKKQAGASPTISLAIPVGETWDIRVDAVADLTYMGGANKYFEIHIDGAVPVATPDGAALLGSERTGPFSTTAIVMTRLTGRTAPYVFTMALRTADNPAGTTWEDADGVDSNGVNVMFVSWFAV